MIEFGIVIGNLRRVIKVYLWLGNGKLQFIGFGAFGRSAGPRPSFGMENGSSHDAHRAGALPRVQAEKFRKNVARILLLGTRPDEYPKHKIEISSFWMDETEVTNAQFKEFTDATGYITTAERSINWDEIKSMLPPGTPKPNDTLLSPSSLVFKESNTNNLNDYSKWWSLVRDSNLKQPFGTNSNI